MFFSQNVSSVKMLLLGVVFAIITILVTTQGHVCKSEGRTNIVIILADDLGWNDVGHHGSSQIPTPNIDAIGYNGIIMDRHYTQQSCTPSRSALLTGKYPITTGFQGFPMRCGENRTLSHDFVTLPQALKTVGYKTHMLGKWHLGAGYKNATPTAYGYDTHYGYWNPYIGYYDHSVQEFDKYFGKDFVDGFKPVNETGYFTDLITRRALKLLKEHEKNTPMLMVVNHLAPHTGRTIRAGYTVVEAPDDEAANVKFSYITDKNRRIYAAAVERLDDSVGMIMKGLADEGMLCNTLVVFISDNGGPTFGLHANYASNYPLRGMKLSDFEGGIRTVGVLYSPKFINRGRIYKHIFHITDWMPTVLEAAGYNLQDGGIGHIDGVSHWNNLVYNLNTRPRDEILVNIDESVQNSGYIGYGGRYKLLNNSMVPFIPGNVYTGDRGFSHSYDVSSILNSLANKAIQYTEKGLDLLIFLRIIYLRRQATLPNCRPTFAVTQCTGKCLFDLENDPCESEDIASSHPDIVERLWSRIMAYNNVRVPQQNTLVDPNADPVRCNGVWFNWLDGPEGCFYNATTSM